MMGDWFQMPPVSINWILWPVLGLYAFALVYRCFIPPAPGGSRHKERNDHE